MNDNIHLVGARKSIIKGIKKVKDFSSDTLGAKGSSKIIEDMRHPGHLVADDSYSILQKVRLGNKLENRGVALLKEAVDRSRKELGDATTTTVILTSDILEEGDKLNMWGHDIKDSLDECLPLIEKYIDDHTKIIEPNEVGDVATVASGKSEIGSMIQEIHENIGKEGVIELDVSTTPETYYDITEGVRLKNCGFMYPYMANDGEGKKAVMISPKILLTRQKISVQKDIDDILIALNKQGIHELVIFCEDIDPRVSETLAMSHQQALFKFLVVKMPTLWKDWLYEDISKITGATVIDPTQGISLQRIQMSMLGTCEKIVSYKDETLVLGTKDITEHIKNLKEAGKKDDQQLLRASWLNTKTAILKIGANSESELALKRLKVENARNSAHLALKGGVVVGGGLALYNAITVLPDTIGGNILKTALKSPIRQIFINSNKEFTGEGIGGNIGLNAKTGKIEDLEKAGIVDAALSVKGAIVNAVRLASTILTSNGAITLE